MALPGSIERMIVIGPPGSGKSTLARLLSPALGLPLIHLDAEFWQPGWRQMPRPEWVRRVRELVAGERWLIEGNFAGTLTIRAPRADAIVLLDLPRRVTMPRVARRVATSYGRVRPDMSPGCPERIDWEFARYCWRFPRDEMPAVIDALDEVDAWDRVIHLRTTREVRDWLRTLPAAGERRDRRARETGGAR